MMADLNYHISCIQIVETERQLKLSSILKLSPGQQQPSQSTQTFVKSFAPPSSSSEDQIIVEHFLMELVPIIY